MACSYQESKVHLKNMQEIGTLMNSDPNNEGYSGAQPITLTLTLAQVLDLLVLVCYCGNCEVDDVVIRGGASKSNGNRWLAGRKARDVKLHAGKTEREPTENGGARRDDTLE